MAYRHTIRGMADVLNPTAGTALDCGLLAGGVFNKACWCLSWPSLCSDSDYRAAYALAHPEVYATLQPPPTVGSPGGGALSTPPASGAEAQVVVDDLIAQQNTAWQAQNAATLAQTQANLDAIPVPSSSFSMPLWLWLAIGAGVLGLAAVGGGSPRRYGR